MGSAPADTWAYRLKPLVIVGLIGGLALATILVLSRGVGTIWHSAAMLGLGGFGFVVSFHIVSICLMGCAWWMLGRHQVDASVPRFIWGRLIRDSASEALPLSQIGGFVLGARALTLTGMSGAFAAASTVVDVTLELAAQIAYTIIGLSLLEWLRPGNAIVGPVLAGVVVMSVAAAIFFAIQARGAGFLERSSNRLARQFLGRDIGQAGAVQAGIRDLQACRSTLLLATSTHLASWLLSGVETWVTVRLMGLAVTLPAALTIDSLIYGMRSVAFMVPNALGVQEGGLVLLGFLFGIGPDASLALSLIRRARDLVIGIPALLVWQAIEGRHAWRAGAAARGSGALFISTVVPGHTSTDASSRPK
jgi:glycosyltransferase 2 family protein